MTDRSHPAVDADLAERLAFVAGSINRRLRPPAEALTHVALSALASIERLGAVRPGDLARIEGIAAPGMTRLVTDLEGRGLVARSADPGDGRSQLIRLTEDGVAAVAAARTAGPPASPRSWPRCSGGPGVGRTSRDSARGGPAPNHPGAGPHRVIRCEGTSGPDAQKFLHNGTRGATGSSPAAIVGGFDARSS